MSVATDPVTTHVVELQRALHGPARMRRSMIAEVRDGLEDAVADYREGGLDPRRAAIAAVRDFGSVHEVAPLIQEELTARQGRRTAQLLVATFPAMLLAWDVLWKSGNGWSAPPPAVVGTLARAVDVLTVLITATALVLLLATFRSSRLPPWVTGLTGFVAALGVLGCSGMSILMNLLNSHQAGDLLAARPATLLVVVATTVTIAAVTRSAVRSMRASLASGRSDEGADRLVGEFDTPT